MLTQYILPLSALGALPGEYESFTLCTSISSLPAHLCSVVATCFNSACNKSHNTLPVLMSQFSLSFPLSLPSPFLKQQRSLIPQCVLQAQEGLWGPALSVLLTLLPSGFAATLVSTMIYHFVSSPASWKEEERETRPSGYTQCFCSHFFDQSFLMWPCQWGGRSVGETSFFWTAAYPAKNQGFYYLRVGVSTLQPKG